MGRLFRGVRAGSAGENRGAAIEVRCGVQISLGEAIRARRRPGRLSMLLVIAVVLLASARGLAQNERITVAVMPMEFRSTGSQWGNIDVARQLTALITNRLVEDGQYDVVEREHIDAILSEQDFGASGRVDPSRAAEIGRLLGADALIFGTVTRFEFSQSQGIGISGLGGLSLSGTTARVALTGRLVDATRGVVLGSVEGEGSNTGASFGVRDLEGISFQTAQFQETTLGKATFAAVDDFVGGLGPLVERSAERIQEGRRARELGGTVLALIDNGVIIDIGEEHGVRQQQRFSVSRLMEVPGLADPVRVPVGVVRVISVDPQASVALFETMSQPVQVGDVVHVQ